MTTSNKKSLFEIRQEVECSEKYRNKWPPKPFQVENDEERAILFEIYSRRWEDEDSDWKAIEKEFSEKKSIHRGSNAKRPVKQDAK